MSKNKEVLTPEFLLEVFKCCLKNEFLLEVVATHLRTDLLPDRDFQTLFEYFCKHHSAYPTPPTMGILRQMATSRRGVLSLLDEIEDMPSINDMQPIFDQLEDFIKHASFLESYHKAGKYFAQQEMDKAYGIMSEYVVWRDGFTLKPDGFVDVVGTFKERFLHNRAQTNNATKQRPITRFYIDEMDVMNDNRDLRGQLTCFLASTGVGKSHALRWIGKSASQIDGLNVLHFQLEGSEAEVVNAYSASLVSCPTSRYESGTLRDADFNNMLELVNAVSGKLFVKTYPKFQMKVTPADFKIAIGDFRKRYNVNPDIVIVDSMDLVTDSGRGNWSEKGLRHARVAVANELKDLASDENVWVVASYQATIENRETINDEKFVLTEYNCSEAKGLARPLTHLITMNQSEKERKEHTMRLYFAKSRFFPKGEAFKIATNYHEEQFYDAVRTLNLNKNENK